MEAVRVGQTSTVIGIKENRYIKSVGAVSKKRRTGMDLHPQKQQL